MGATSMGSATDPSASGATALRTCIQCGTCSAVCPMLDYMDHSPRLLNAMLLAGRYDDVVRSRSIWVCTSCYACTVECPQGLPITDEIYALKRASQRDKLHPQDFPTVVMAQQFVQLVDRRGRSSELWISLALSLRTRPGQLVRYAPLAWRLLRRGRLRLQVESVDRPRQLHQLFDALELHALEPTGGSPT